ncbi:MAG: hypothetical protein QM690_07140, partial [Sphingobium sp.]
AWRTAFCCSTADASKDEEIREALSGRGGGRTTILIAHRPSSLRMADRVLLLDGGRIAAEGRHDELLRTSGAYRRVLAATGGGDRLEAAE